MRPLSPRAYASQASRWKGKGVHPRSSNHASTPWGATTGSAGTGRALRGEVVLARLGWGMDEPLELVERVRVLGGLVRAPPGDAREAQGHAGLVPGRGGDALEVQLEHLRGLHRAHGAELLLRV